MQRLAKRGLASKSAKSKEHDEETINELKEAFKIFDSKNTGKPSFIQDKLMQDNLKLS